jgi:hypothetical protein
LKKLDGERIKEQEKKIGNKRNMERKKGTLGNHCVGAETNNGLLSRIFGFQATTETGRFFRMITVQYVLSAGT